MTDEQQCPIQSGPLANAPAVAILLVLVIVGAIYLGQGLERAEDSGTYVKLTLGLLACAFAPIVLRSWRTSLGLALIYLFFSGFLTHLTHYDDTMRLAKFVLVALVVGHFVLEKTILRHETIWPDDPEAVRTTQYILALTLLAILQTANPHWSSLKVGLIASIPSLLTHILPMHLFVIGYHLLERRETLRHFCHLIVGLVTIMAIFSWVQHFYLGFEGMAALSPTIETVLIREHVWLSDYRPVYKPISFAADAGAASYFMALGLIFCATILSRSGLRIWTQIYLLASGMLMSVALLLTYVRVSFVISVLGICGVAALGRSAKVLLLLVILMASMFTLNEVEDDFLLIRFTELTNPVDSFQRNRGMQAGIIWVFMRNYPLGTGVGRSGPVPYYKAPLADQRVGVASENYFGAVALELGIPGVLLLSWIFLRIVYQGWRSCYRLESHELRVYGYGALATLVAVLITGFSGQMLYTTPSNFLFWFVAGILCSLGALERRALAQEAELRAASLESDPNDPPARAVQDS